MKVAVVNETSSVDKNAAILDALEGRGFEVINAGMKKNGDVPELSYIHTGLIAAMLLNLELVDFVIGGCGTGQGFLLSVMQYPRVYCGHILSPLDAWLFAQINDGNCISLALNQGYGWAGDINIKFIFDKLFNVERGCGYPSHRQIAQRESRKTLESVSKITHLSFVEIIDSLPDSIIKPVLKYPGIENLIDINSIKDDRLRIVFEKRLKS
jgi:ribose 5-phosphate isomerase RpiB